MYGMLLNCTPENGENGKFYIYFITIEKKRIPGTENWVRCRAWEKERGDEKVHSCIVHHFLLSFSPKVMALETKGSEKKISMKLRELIEDRSVGQASIYLTHIPAP